MEFLFLADFENGHTQLCGNTTFNVIKLLNKQNEKHMSARASPMRAYSCSAHRRGPAVVRPAAGMQTGIPRAVG